MDKKMTTGSTLTLTPPPWQTYAPHYSDEVCKEIGKVFQPQYLMNKKYKITINGNNIANPKVGISKSINFVNGKLEILSDLPFYLMKFRRLKGRLVSCKPKKIEMFKGFDKLKY